MSYIFIAIAGQHHPLSAKDFNAMRNHLSGIAMGETRWLAQDEACECRVELAQPTGSNATVAHKLSMIPDAVAVALVELRRTYPFDIALLPVEHRKKKLLIADMESTIIQEELVDELAKRTGNGDEIAAITARAMRGELEFATALEQRVATFAGLDANRLDELYESAVTLMPGAATLIKTMNHCGAMTALVSGGFTVFTKRIADRLGFHVQKGNVLETENGRLTGKIVHPILDRNGKAEALEALAQQCGLTLNQTLAVGDGANDLEMIKRAGLGVAYHAKSVVAESADVAINHGDLTALLYLQGIAKQDFVHG